MNQTPQSFYSPAHARMIVAAADPEDNWVYAVIALPENKAGLVVISVTDDDGNLPGCL